MLTSSCIHVHDMVTYIRKEAKTQRVMVFVRQ